MKIIVSPSELVLKREAHQKSWLEHMVLIRVKVSQLNPLFGSIQSEGE